MSNRNLRRKYTAIADKARAKAAQTGDFFDVSDAFTTLANSLAATVDCGRVSGALMFACASYCAFNAQQAVIPAEKAIEFFLANFEEKLQFNIKRGHVGFATLHEEGQA